MNRVVLITGASRGLGASIAKLFLDKQDIVYINYHNSYEEALKLSSAYKNAYLIKCDITDEKEIEEMITKIEEEQGRIDILVNNAGISNDSLVEQKTKQSFQKVLDVNLIGTFLVSKYTKRIMDRGTIINISSNSGIDAYYPYGLDYDASKAGVISLTHNLALEYAPNIRVNAIAPGWINTHMNEKMDLEYRNQECENILLQRFAEPIEIAKVVFFLASDDASYINDSIIKVDGGLK